MPFPYGAFWKKLGSFLRGLREHSGAFMPFILFLMHLQLESFIILKLLSSLGEGLFIFKFIFESSFPYFFSCLKNVFSQKPIFFFLVQVCVSKKPWPEHERLTFNFRGGGSAVQGSWGGREGGQNESEALQRPPTPLHPQAKAEPIHPMLNRKKESRGSDRCGDDSVSGSSFEVLMLPELWEQQSAFAVLPSPLTSREELGVFSPG